MDQQTAQRVLSHPKFQEMARKKSVLGWSFSALMLFVYVVFILFIGFSPESFGVPVSPGSVTTWGIYVGLFVILFAISITGIYVRQANGPLEEITQEVVREVTAANAPATHKPSVQSADSDTAKEA